MISRPTLYSYRRCPYAIRARMALRYAGIEVTINEIVLNEKPEEMLLASPKGTVPVLLFESGCVIDQSLDIMYWALQHKDVDEWLTGDAKLTHQLITENDGSFKHALDKYKYAIRFPEQTCDIYRSQCEEFLMKLEGLLTQSKFLIKNQVSLADVAIFPFIRQFSLVDKAWFEDAPYPQLRVWLLNLINSELFISVMEKKPT